MCKASAVLEQDPADEDPARAHILALVPQHCLQMWGSCWGSVPGLLRPKAKAQSLGTPGEAPLEESPLLTAAFGACQGACGQTIDPGALRLLAQGRWGSRRVPRGPPASSWHLPALSPPDECVRLVLQHLCSANRRGLPPATPD